ncbi:glycosyltransferase family 4 protein [Patescibacteria group bacterium]|nr:glycosyltransferase family 4 protein [Patescibacteria group bacterium]
MKIAQIAPIVERVPPKKYGGTERVVHVLTEELVKLGHEVTLFATADSITSAKLVGTVDKGLREKNITDSYTKNGYTLSHVGKAYDRYKEFDIIHDHVGALSLPTANICPKPVISTLHGAFFDHNKKLYESLNNPYFVTISDAQGEPVPDLHKVATVYNGLNMSHYPFEDEPEDYLLYVGRIAPIKGTHLAVQIAHELGLPLIIAAKLEEENKEYFDKEVKPYLSSTIRWVGEVDEEERNRLMSKAKCFLHPATWEEPFGLTLIEAMACGCPVVAFSKGSIPEIIEDKKTGFVVKDLKEMATAILSIEQIDRWYCREYALTKFNAQKMAEQYESLYYLILGQTVKDFEPDYDYVQSIRPRLSAYRELMFT